MVAKIITDGWANIKTALGITGRDKRMSAAAFWEPMDERTAEELYASDHLAGKIVNCLPEDAFREGYDLVDFGSAADVEKLEGEKTRLGIDAKLEAGYKLGRMYGGAGVWIVANDEVNQALPLNMNRITRVVNLIPLTKWELQPTGEVTSNPEDPNFGMPETYQVSPRGAALNVNHMAKIHHSRIIRFDGAWLPPSLLVENNYWHDSVLTKSLNSLRNYNGSMDSAASALLDFRVGVYKIPNLHSLVGNGKDDQIISRLRTVDALQSIVRAKVLDEKESWEQIETTFTGVAPLLLEMKNGVQAAADNIPHTKLWGESPAGLGGSGRATEVTWYDFVSARQEQYIGPRLLRLFQILAAQKQLGIKAMPQEAKIKFRPLWQLDEKEQVEMRAKQAETDAKYIDMAVLDATEVRAQRFGVNGYSIDTKVEGEPPLPPVPPVPQLPSPTADSFEFTDEEVAMFDGGPGSGPQGGGGGGGDKPNSSVKVPKVAPEKIGSGPDGFDHATVAAAANKEQDKMLASGLPSGGKGQGRYEKLKNLERKSKDYGFQKESLAKMKPDDPARPLLEEKHREQALKVLKGLKALG